MVDEAVRVVKIQPLIIRQSRCVLAVATTNVTIYPNPSLHHLLDTPRCRVFWVIVFETLNDKDPLSASSTAGLCTSVDRSAQTSSRLKVMVGSIVPSVLSQRVSPCQSLCSEQIPRSLQEARRRICSLLLIAIQD